MTFYAWFIIILCFHDCSNFPKSYPRTFVNKLAVYRSSEDDGTDARDELDNKFPSSPSQMDRSDNPTTKTPKPASSSNDISVQFEDCPELSVEELRMLIVGRLHLMFGVHRNVDIIVHTFLDALHHCREQLP